MLFGVAPSPSRTSLANVDSSSRCGRERRVLATATIRASLTMSCVRRSHASDEFGQTDAAELPTRRRVEKVAIAHTLVTLRSRQRRTAQHHLVDHEFTVVF